MKYLNQKAIKDLFHEHGKQVSKGGLEVIDRWVEKKLKDIADDRRRERRNFAYNGNHKRYDESILTILLK